MAEANALPQRTHVYQNHHLDSTRWDAIALRPDDIVITTAYKAGTTWMQTIVGHLIFWGREFPEVLLKASPWLDMRILPLDEIRAELDAQQHRRFIKTHLPLDGLPYREDLRYIMIGRDPPALMKATTFATTGSLAKPRSTASTRSLKWPRTRNKAR